MGDIKWFIGFLVVIGAVWLSGKAKSADRSVENPPATPKTQTVPVETGQLPKDGPSAASPGGTVISESVLPEALNLAISPLQGKLTVSTIGRGAVAKEYVIIQASSRNKNDIDITGFTIRSGVSLNGQTIGNGWKVYFPNTIGEGESILLRPGARAYLLSGRPPTGVSLPKGGGFELNLCTGFLEQGRNFYPGLPRECPRPQDGPLPLPPNQLSEDCYDYLARLSRCVVPSSVPANLASDGSCRAYLFNHINYGQCVTDYKNDPMFFKGEWRIYFGRDAKLWRDTREIVELLDTEGKLIDARRFGY